MYVFDFFCGAFHSFALYYRSIAAAVAARKGRRRMKRIRHLLGRWTDVSIWVKSILLMGIMLVSLWTLVILATQQLRGFSAESDVIMNEYMDITGFMNAFSAENVALETYIRPSLSVNALEDYIESRTRTDQCLRELIPNLRVDGQTQFVLKQAISNAMIYYRKSQNELLAMDSDQEKMRQYLSMKTQSAYIDGYTRDLLHTRMEQGGRQWQQISTANGHRTRQLLTFLIIITLMVCVVLMIFVRSVLRPVTELGHAADRISVGQYDAPPLEIRGRDELGRTARSFNLMQQEIRSTIHALEKQSEMEKNLRKKEAEAAQMQRALQEGRFAHLQSQINPHFLFNTLSTIAALSREEGAPLSEDLIIRLSNFFRYSLESDEKMVSLGREVELLQDYIELQETRYSGRIHTEIRIEPGLERVTVPYEYKDVDHLFKVLDGDIGQEVFDTFKDNNLVGITYLHPGSRNFFNSKKEIHTPADLAGMKIRVSESDLMLKMMESLGGVGVGLPFNDTYSSIQTGVVDGAENNMTSYIEMSFYEVAPYWTYDGHSYMPDMILASKQTMDKLSEDDQQIIFDCAKEAEEWHRTAWEDSEAKNAKIAEEKGCTLTTLTDDELKQFQDAVAPMYDSFLNDEQKAIVERVKALA